MSFWDLLLTAFHNLWVRKLRTFLNLVGIVISCVLLLTTLAAASGIQQAIQRFVETSHEALKFRIVPTYDASIEPPAEALQVEGEISEQRKQRLEAMLRLKWQQQHLPHPSAIEYAQLDALRDLEHVVDIVPRLQFNCTLRVGDQSAATSISGTSLQDHELGSRIVIGSPLSASAPDGMLMHEALAFDMGIRDDRALAELIGTEVVVQFLQSRDPFQMFGEDFYRQSAADQQKLMDVLEAIVSGNGGEALDPGNLEVVRRFAESRAAARETAARTVPKGQTIEKKFRIVGIFRDPDQNDEATILSLYLGGAERLLVEHSQLRPISVALGSMGTSFAMVYIDHVKHLEALTERLKQESVASISAASTVQRLYEAIDRSEMSMLGVAAVILLVAAVGISNTMIISIVERSEEIGIMKAIGANNRQVTAIILLECMATGFMGGVLSIAATSLIAKAGNGILRSYVEQRARLELEGSVFSLEPWMMLATVLVATLIAACAGIWPARKAARLDPITAMGRL